MNPNEIIGFDALWDSCNKCKRGVSWKAQVAQFTLNQVSRTLALSESLQNGTYHPGRPSTVKITHPKPRDALSVQFQDRVYQRSLNDNALYPNLTRSFIYGNAACQFNKGTKFARDLIKKYLWNYYTHYGNSGYLIHIDLHSYYQTMRHSTVEDKFHKGNPKDIADMAVKVLDNQYAGDVGYVAGSQMVQIAGISVLDSLDHYIKERLHCRYYVRYMDDLMILCPDIELAIDTLYSIKSKLHQLGFETNSKKTGIDRIARPFKFLGFYYTLSDTGKIYMRIDPNNVKSERKKLYRLVNLSKKGKMTKKQVDLCFEGWIAHASVGDTYILIQRMRKYYKSLWEGKDHESGTLHT